MGSALHQAGAAAGVGRRRPARDSTGEGAMLPVLSQELEEVVTCGWLHHMCPFQPHPVCLQGPTEGWQRSNTQWEHTIRHTRSQLEGGQRAGRMGWEQGLWRHHAMPHGPRGWPCPAGDRKPWRAVPRNFHPRKGPGPQTVHTGGEHAPTKEEAHRHWGLKLGSRKLKSVTRTKGQNKKLESRMRASAREDDGTGKRQVRLPGPARSNSRREQ